jgi:two-component system, NarL family, nitrate/nitrite sensor histidine kinase NarX
MNTNLLSGRALSVKLVCVAMAFCAVALAGIGLTLFESWKLEGGAAVINDLGSERMRTYRIAYLLSESLREPVGAVRADMRTEMRRFEEVLDVLERGDPARPLVLPRVPAIVSELAEVREQWTRIKPLIERAAVAEGPTEAQSLMRELRGEVEALVARIDRLVRAVERDNAENLELLRYLQLGLIALALAGTVALIYLMFMLVVRPVETLSEGMRRLSGRDFNVRLPVETRDEFGELAAGFNRMADEVQQVYTTLEQRVADKTRDLARKNRELGTLYDVATLLNKHGPIEDACRHMLRKLQALLGASAGAVRIVEPGSAQLHMYIHEGLSQDLARAEQCMSVGDCFCGQAAQRKRSVIEHFAAGREDDVVYGCAKSGYETVAIFPIRSRNALLGVFDLHFRQKHVVTRAERQMLEAVGRHLGAAIENDRLIARVKEMAVSEERNFLAQELHDSIAQSLAFLNLETQMLADALKRTDMAEAQGLVSDIRKGVDESYENVRELLVHFRTRVKHEDIALTIRQTLERFETQTGIRTRFTESGTAVPLPPDRQLQVLHILQEALSNVRKHAGASVVEVSMQRNGVYEFCVRDDGAGFDLAAAEHPEGRHMGLRIMRERAQRIGAAVRIESELDRGTCVTLVLPLAQTEAPRAAA